MSAAGNELPEGEHVSAHARKHAHVGHASWYAVQVMAGREEHMREAIMRAVELEERLAEEREEAARDACDAESAPHDQAEASKGGAAALCDANAHGAESASHPIVEELFVPKARVGVKRGGKWVPGEETLLPGYLIAVCRDPAALARAMRRAGGFARIVSQDNVFISLPEENVKWLEAQTQRGGAAVEMSEGYVEGGVLHVTSDPLVGREADVVRVNHRRKVAYLQIEAFGRTITAQLGIKIVRRKQKKTCQKNLKTE